MGTSNEQVLLDNTINNLHTYITLSVGKCENKLIKSLKRNKLKKCIEDRWVRLSDWGDNDWLQLPRPPHTHTFRSAWLPTNSSLTMAVSRHDGNNRQAVYYMGSRWRRRRRQQQQQQSLRSAACEHVL
ncbi:hypothetical protein Pcinc_023009 [Petrolisthes cinctipes]|uniref:Uncharacterized protein n=1 Tax=Petrolisthes cinctipes TaxID=88211 RepID=A0AAE1FDN1_PETCI|nr:hypothetical protein Pcinc_023009 [Petrolisthes cinctipes]